MTRSTILSILAVGVLAGAAPAAAATAHNSQAGAYGPNTHICEATPYFRTGGCVSAALDDENAPFVVGPTPFPPRGRLSYPSDVPPPGGRLSYPNDLVLPPPGGLD